MENVPPPVSYLQHLLFLAFVNFYQIWVLTCYCLIPNEKKFFLKAGHILSLNVSSVVNTIYVYEVSNHWIIFLNLCCTRLWTFFWIWFQECCNYLLFNHRCDPLPRQLWVTFLLSEEQMDLDGPSLDGNQLHIPVKGERQLFERAVGVIQMVNQMVNVCL